MTAIPNSALNELIAKSHHLLLSTLSRPTAAPSTTATNTTVPPQESGHTSLRVSEIAHGLKQEVESWWKHPKAAMVHSSPSRPDLPRRKSSDGIGFESNQRPSTSTMMIQDDYAPVVDPSRAHLHYRDRRHSEHYPIVPIDDRSRFPTTIGSPSSNVALGVGSLKEEHALRDAVINSQIEADNIRSRNIQEEEQVQRALDESIELARAKAPPLSQERRELESKRQLLLDSQRRLGISRSRTSSAPLASPFRSPGPSRSAALADLESSEWKLLERNEKGRLYREGALHGWLPPGGGRGNELEESREREMMELAIQLSLAEAEENQIRELARSIPPPLPPRRQGVVAASIAPSSVSTYTDTTDRSISPSFSDASAPAAPPPLPTRPVPPPPSVDASSDVRRELSFIPSAPPKIFTADRGGSPIERPFLTPSTSIRSGIFNHELDAKDDVAAGEIVTKEEEEKGQEANETGSDSQDETRSPPNSAAIDSLPRLTYNLSDLNRSLSLVSERTETDSRMMFNLEEPARRGDEGGVEEMIGEDDIRARTSRAESFEDGTVFGFDYGGQIHSEKSFPTNVVLSTYEDEDDRVRNKFTIEAKSYGSLIRVLLWYGDRFVEASERDVEEEMTKHCDAALSLTFRTNELGQSILRLSVELLPPNQRRSHQELTVVDTRSDAHVKGKGKGVEDNTRTQSFRLPDYIILPCRLSSIAISIFTLRHISNIAISTIPATTASASYHALRALALAFEELSDSESMAIPEDSGKLRKEDERVVGRLRDRLRSWHRRSSTSGSSNGGGGGKLLKAPPNDVSMGKTRTIKRDLRVLSNEEETEGAGAREGAMGKGGD